MVLSGHRSVISGLSYGLRLAACAASVHMGALHCTVWCLFVESRPDGSRDVDSRVHMQDLEIPDVGSRDGQQPGDRGSDTPGSDKSMNGNGEAPLREVIDQAVFQAMEVALNYHRTGQLPQAEDAYRAILELVPEHGDANHNLAVIALESGHAAASVALFHKALDGQPENQTYWVSLFDAMLQSGDIAGATQALERRANAGMPVAVVHELIGRIVGQRHAVNAKSHSQPRKPGKPAQPSAKMVDEVNRLFQAERLEQVLTHAKALVRRFPDDGFGWRAMGAALINLGRSDQAMESLRRAVDLGPQDVRALSNLGFALQLLGRPVESEVSLRLALKYRPDFAAAHVNLGATLLRQDRFDDAEVCLRRAVEIEPDCAPAFNQLAHADDERGLLVRALAGYRHTLALPGSQMQSGRTPNHLLAVAYAHQGVSSTLARLADFTQVLEQTTKALALCPDDKVLWEKHLYSLSYHPDMSADDIFARFVQWGDRQATPKTDFSTHDRSPRRRIKVGYVSPDFRRHTSRFYFLPFFSNHDPALIELHAYSNVKSEDDFTARFRVCFEYWHDIRGLTDEEAAAMIRLDGIDILVDCCNHMRDERLGVFVLKPAPIQVTWLGAAWTTGLKEVDYVLFDHHIAPASTLSRENIVRLPNCFVPFQALDVTEPAEPPPCLRNGYITFAYSGRTERLNHHTFRVWSEILRRLPNAQLVLDFRNFSDPDNRDYFSKLMQAQGLDTQRVTMRNSVDIFKGLHDFDILLDCFPHSGGTMLLDALWMGVPALTMSCRPPLGRIGTTFIRNVGLPQWVARDEQEYIDKACAFAADVDGLTQLRASMRERMLKSPLMDGKGFVHGVEAAYRIMWERFCAGEVPTPISLPAGDGAQA